MSGNVCEITSPEGKTGLSQTKTTLHSTSATPQNKYKRAFAEMPNKWWKAEYPRKTYMIAMMFISVLTLIGIPLVVFHPDIQIGHSMDYTNCKVDSGLNLTCKEYLKQTNKSHCTCYMGIKLIEPMPGPITLYYSLPQFDQTRKEYASSKDDEQLAGNLSLTVSENCGNYSYGMKNGKKTPIAPCGIIADSMFPDRYKLIRIDPAGNTHSYVSTLPFGFDYPEWYKRKFCNPPGDLEIALKNYASPPSWYIDVTSLDPCNPGNNGFQNDGLITWMTPEINPKPVFRIHHIGKYIDGLPADDYAIEITYYRSNYNYGPRQIWLSSSQTTMSHWRIFGIVLIVIGFIGIGFCLPFLWSKIREWKQTREENVVSDTEPTESNNNNIS